jgi:hypothetical protein
MTAGRFCLAIVDPVGGLFDILSDVLLESHFFHWNFYITGAISYPRSFTD